MFGYHKARREKKRAKREKLAMQEEVNRLKQEKLVDPVQEQKTHQEQVNQISNEQLGRDQQAQQRGTERFDELMNRGYKGLEDTQRRSLQESANSQINKDIQGYEKKILAQQGRRGVKGGAAYAQQRDLAQLGTEAQQQMQRDLSTLDADLVLRKIAAAYNVEQGEVGQEALRQQMARDTLGSYDQKKYQKWLAEQANKLFQRI